MDNNFELPKPTPDQEAYLRRIHDAPKPDLSVVVGGPRDTVKLDIPTPVEAATKRALMAIDSGYFPEQMRSDLETLMRAALCWDMYCQKK